MYAHTYMHTYLNAAENNTRTGSVCREVYTQQVTQSVGQLLHPVCARCDRASVERALRNMQHTRLVSKKDIRAQGCSNTHTRN